ncbi:MAG: hypothetical protein ABRQ24_04140 [Syntrophomonadaceae bacterium]
MARCANCKRRPADQKTAVRIVGKSKKYTRELPYCSQRCKEDLHSFIDSHNRAVPRFKNILMVWTLVFLGAVLVQIITGNPLFKNIITPAVAALIGIVLIVYPSGLMELKYYERVGIKWFSLYVRVTGLIIVGTAASMIFQAY